MSVSDASGSCTLAATRAADDNFNASAASAPFTVTLHKLGQTITFGALASKTFGDPDFAVSATGGASGNAVTFTASGQCTADTDGDPVHLTAAGSCTITAHQLGNTNYAAAADVPQTFSIASGDTQGPIVSNTAALPVAINTAGTVTATINDYTTGNHKVTRWYFTIDNTYTSSTMNVASPAVSVNVSAPVPAGSSADVRVICVYGYDEFNNLSAAPDCALQAVYDPSAGFVTGGGWINSPAGAYRDNTSLTGKANFGFVSKYTNGRTIPTGNTEFQFQTAGFNFSSTVYEWLVVSGAMAQYKGSGTINGSGDYGFLLSAVDGAISGGGGTDKFRIKVWNKTTGAVIYDNNYGASDTSTPTTVLGGGSIVIHK